MGANQRRREFIATVPLVSWDSLSLSILHNRALSVWCTADILFRTPHVGTGQSSGARVGPITRLINYLWRAPIFEELGFTPFITSAMVHVFRSSTPSVLNNQKTYVLFYFSCRIIWFKQTWFFLGPVTAPLFTGYCRMRAQEFYLFGFWYISFGTKVPVTPTFSIFKFLHRISGWNFWFLHHRYGNFLHRISGPSSSLSRATFMRSILGPILMATRCLVRGSWAILIWFFVGHSPKRRAFYPSSPWFWVGRRSVAYGATSFGAPVPVGGDRLQTHFCGVRYYILTLVLFSAERSDLLSLEEIEIHCWFRFLQSERPLRPFGTPFRGSVM